MPNITFILPDGAERRVAATAGHSLMETARDHAIPGIVAECNGSLACATCHCYVTNGADYGIEMASGDEADMLDFTASPRQALSRLSCQIRVTEGMEGLVVTLPPTQV